jgi:hypothetical protein
MEPPVAGLPPSGSTAGGRTTDDFRQRTGIYDAFHDEVLIHPRGRAVRCGSTVVKMAATSRGTYVCSRVRAQQRPQPAAAR